jgi:hypothetical protein
MRQEGINDQSDEDSKRLIRVEHKTFRQVVTVLETEILPFGQPPKLSCANQLWTTYDLKTVNSQQAETVGKGC